MTSQDLENRLQRIDNRPYPAYKDIRGNYAFSGFSLSIDKVQGDPFAAPSRLSISIPHSSSKLPPNLFSNVSRRTGTENFLALSFSKACRNAASQLGSGKSGLIAIDTPGQEMLVRSCVEIGNTATTIRFSVGLPANGRKIRGHAAAKLLTKSIPEIVEQSLLFENLPEKEITTFADAAEDADFLRDELAKLNLVAFVADGSVLPRASGVDHRPLEGAVPFASPESLRISIDLPNAGPVSGMAIPAGITLIVGGGYHGKSTLLNAVERGIYNHRPRDGRELVVSSAQAVKVRAEDGRSVASVDLSPFIDNLPGGKDASSFSTENASGSSSQAANIIEALETGANALLLDEDISATNLLIRDGRMQKLIASEKEPITPFVQRVRSLYEDCGVSTIIVLGGSSDYFDSADLVIGMDNYLPYDLTAEAKALCDGSILDLPVKKGDIALNPCESKRFAAPRSINPFVTKRGSQREKLRAHETHALSVGSETIELSLIPQLIDASQTRSIGAAISYAVENNLFDNHSLPQAFQMVIELLRETPLSTLGNGDLAQIRLHELSAAVNRLRSLQIQR